MTNTNDTDWQADWAIEIDRGRLALDGSLVDAINALTRAQQALATLTSTHVYDTEFAENPQGDDIASFLSDSLRNTRAAYHIAHRVIEDERT